jgi:hypothetical protein
MDEEPVMFWSEMENICSEGNLSKRILSLNVAFRAYSFAHET